MRCRRLFTFLLLICLMLSAVVPAHATGFSIVNTRETDAERLLRGWDEEKGYIYIGFGNYPYTAEGDIRPVTWKVLGIENNYAFLLTQYVIDFAQYHHEKVTIEEWKLNDIYTTLNFTIREKMFTEQELKAVRYSEEMGWLFYLTNKQLRTEAYGFKPWQLRPQKPRECAPTPYAMTHPEAWQDPGNGNTWYFSTGVPRRGFHNLIGYDGHTSTAANNRYGGVRPGCYVDLAMLDNATGSGTIEDPYLFEVVDP